MLLATLAFIAVMLTYGMFQSKQSMLGFPCVLFWAVAGGQAYITAAASPPVNPWGDIYFYIAFVSFLGMVPFCAFGAFALRTKKEELAEGDEFIDEGKDDVKFIDEGGKTDSDTGDDDKPRRSSRNIRERAIRRRSRWD